MQSGSLALDRGISKRWSLLVLRFALRAAVPSDFQALRLPSPEAKAFFETLEKANRYAVLWRIQTVKKTDTEVRRITHLIEILERKEKVHE
jgi:uncharacterized protein YdeI (YjbR/CyaY-like superfamily)